MKGKIAFAFAAILAVSVTGVARADDKKEIEAGYKKLENAIISRSVDGVMSVGTPDFSMKMGGMVMSAQQVKSQMKMNFDMMKTAPKFTMTIRTMDIKKNSAEVLSTGIMSADIVDTPGMFGKKGSKHKLTDEQTSKDTWVKTGNSWKMKVTETVSEKMTLDGKPYNPAGAPPGGGAPKR